MAVEEPDRQALEDGFGHDGLAIQSRPSLLIASALVPWIVFAAWTDSEEQ
jgi:hypothetical protein